MCKKYRLTIYETSVPAHISDTVKSSSHRSSAHSKVVIINNSSYKDNDRRSKSLDAAYYNWGILLPCLPRRSSHDLMRSCTNAMIYTQVLGSVFEASMLHYIDYELVWSLECVFVEFFDFTLWVNGWFKHRFLKSQSDWHNNSSLWIYFVEIRYVLVIERKFAFLFL